MAFFNFPPPPVSNNPNDPSFRDWFYKIARILQDAFNLENATGVLPVEHGGTGQSEVPANGELLIGDGSGFTLNNLTAGSNVTITNGPGSITISSTSGNDEIDGGFANSVYLLPQNINGGTASG